MPGPSDILKLLQAGSDVRTLTRPRREQLLQELELERSRLSVRDPGVELLLASPDIDPFVKRLISAREENERQLKALQIESEKYLVRQSRPPAFTLAFGFIPTFQFGSAAGLEGWSAFLLDVIADPLNLVGVGGLTKAGRLGAILKGLSREQKAEELINAAKIGARLLGGDVELAGKVEVAVNEALRGEPTLLRDLVKTGAEITDDVAQRLLEVEGGRELLGLLKGEKRIRKALEFAFTEGEQFRKYANVSGFFNQIRHGQRSILSFGLPNSPAFELTLGSYANDIGLPSLEKIAAVEEARTLARRAPRIEAAVPGTVAESPLLEKAPRVFHEGVARHGSIPKAAEDAIRVSEAVSRDAEATLKELTGLRERLVDDLTAATGLKKDEVLDDLNEIAVRALGREGDLDDAIQAWIRETVKTEQAGRRAAIEVAEEALRPTTPRPLTPEEIRRIPKSAPGETGRDVLRRYLQSDEGREVTRRYIATSVAEDLVRETSSRAAARKFISERIKAFAGDLTAWAKRYAPRRLVPPKSLRDHQIARRLFRSAILRTNQVAGRTKYLKLEAFKYIFQEWRKADPDVHFAMDFYQALSEAFDLTPDAIRRIRDAAERFPVAGTKHERYKVASELARIARKGISERVTQKTFPGVREKNILKKKIEAIWKPLRQADAEKRRLARKELQQIYKRYGLKVDRKTIDKAIRRLPNHEESGRILYEAFVEQSRRALASIRQVAKSRAKAFKAVHPLVDPDDLGKVLRSDAGTAEQVIAEVSQAAADAVNASEDVIKKGVAQSATSAEASLDARLAAVAGGHRNAEYLEFVDQTLKQTTQKFAEFEFIGSEPQNVRVTLANHINWIRSVPPVIGRVIRTFVGHDDDLLRRMFFSIDDPQKFPIEDLPSHAQALTHVLADFLDGLGKLLRQEGVINELVADYIPRVINITDPKERERILRIVRQRLKEAKAQTVAGTVHARRRRFETATELIEFLKSVPELQGYELETRIDQAITHYLYSAGSALLRKRTLAKLGRMHALDGLPIMVIANEKYLLTLPEELAERVTEAIADPLFYKSIRSNLWSAVKVHRDYYEAIASVMETRLINPELTGTTLSKMQDAVAWLNDMGKTSIFRFGAFHFQSLQLGAIPSLGIRQSLRMFRFNLGNISKQAVTDPELLSLMVYHRVLQLTADGKATMTNTVDLMHRFFLSNAKVNREVMGGSYDVFDRTLKVLGDKLPFIRSPITGLRHVNKILDKNLWDVWQNGMKFMIWVHKRAAYLKKAPWLLKPENATELAKLEYEIANHANKALGGLAWEMMFAQQEIRTFLRFAFIAADWTLSNLLMARDLVFLFPGIRNTRLARFLTPDVLVRDKAFQMAAQYAFRSSLYSFLFANAVNWAFTGHTLFENDPDSVDEDTGIPRIELPFRAPDGRKLYMNYVKQFAEPIAWVKPLIIDGNITEWAKFLSPKLGVIPHIFTSFIIGYNVGLERPVQYSSDGPFALAWHALKEGGSMFVPITMQNVYKAATGQQSVLQSIIGSIGFPVRKERYDVFQARQKEEERQRLIQELQATGGTLSGGLSSIR